MNELELKSLDHKTLLAKTETLVREERRITTEVLQCLREVESRMLHASLGYSSLYEFCVKHLHYSEGSAHRRISAMRLLKALPQEVHLQVEKKINEGSLTLTNLASVQGFLKTEKKESGKNYSTEEKIDLLQSIEHQSKRDVEKKLAAIQPKIIPQQSERVITESLTEIKFIADEKLMEKLKRIREVSAHRMAAHQKLAQKNKMDDSESISDFAQLLHLMADEYLKKNDPLEKAKTEVISDQSSTSPATKPCVTSESRHIPSAIKKQVWLRDGGKCTFKNHETNQQCDSKHGLEIDHIEPFALGGSHSLQNLRLLCHTHNQYHAQRTFGAEKREHYFRA